MCFLSLSFIHVIGQPSRQPTQQPTMQPSRQPSRQPTQQPSQQPTQSPTGIPLIKVCQECVEYIVVSRYGQFG